MAAKFGTSGLRGLVEELLGGTTCQYVHAFLDHLLQTGAIKRGHNVYVGWDFRPSSPVIRDDAVAAISGKGLRPVLCGQIPTPAIALYAMQNGAASIMITGSHIPADRNGIKFFRPDGEISKQDEVAISNLLARPQAYDGKASSTLAVDESDMATAQFLGRYSALIRHQPLRGRKICVYQHSTVARDLLVDVLKRAGADVVPVGRTCGFIPVDTEAISDETREALKRWSTLHECDAIVSADGDGDRPLVADERGSVIRGDLLGLLTAKFLNASAIAIPVTCNSNIDRFVQGKVIRTRVGSPYVIAAMEEAVNNGKSDVVGFEANGGFLTMSTSPIGTEILSPLPTRDSFLPILAVLLTCASSGKPLSTLDKDYRLPMASSGLIRQFPQERATALLEHLGSHPDQLAAFLKDIGIVAHIDNTDGLRVTLNDNSILHLRPSGNAPEFRYYVEANESKRAKQLMQWCLDRLTHKSELEN